jgi:hypothetical protein
MELQMEWKYCYTCSDLAVDGKRVVNNTPTAFFPGKELPIFIEYEAIWARVGVEALQRR